MKKTRLVEVLRSFDKKELRELKKWLHSPIHNQREDVRQLFAYLIDGKRLDKEHLIENIKNTDRFLLRFEWAASELL